MSGRSENFTEKRIEMTDFLDVHARIGVRPETLQTVVKNSKIVSREKGARLDPADAVGLLVTRFLEEHDFQAFVEDTAHYPG